jgi:hypothetical protein
VEEKKTRSIAAWVLAAVFALLLAFDVWEGIGNFIGVMAQSLSLGLGLSVFGWCAIIFGIIAPAALFFGALWLTRNKALPASFVTYVVALSLSAVVGVDLALGTNAFLIFSVN